MSTATLPSRSIAPTTCSTEAMASASCRDRAASTHTDRISWTRADSRVSSSSTSSPMAASPKYTAA
jgi:hypothetical protein